MAPFLAFFQNFPKWIWILIHACYFCRNFEKLTTIRRKGMAEMVRHPETYWPAFIILYQLMCSELKMHHACPPKQYSWASPDVRLDSGNPLWPRIALLAGNSRTVAPRLWYTLLTFIPCFVRYFAFMMPMLRQNMQANHRKKRLDRHHLNVICPTKK